MKQAILEAKALNKQFKLQGKPFLAVASLELQIIPGETLGIVGESGSGKSTAGKLLLKLEESTSGQILYRGQDITAFSARQMRPLRKHMQMIFQDPYSSLNPRMKVIDILREPLTIHRLCAGKEEQRIEELLEQVGLAADMRDRYPHEFSGGQRQRIAIARALAVEPEVIVCDEPISALDISIQAQIVNLLKDLQDQLGIAYFFIGHDLAMMKYISHRVAIMYRGEIVEQGPSATIFTKPLHPYTKALIQVNKQQACIKGEISQAHLQQERKGCSFYDRCPQAIDLCLQEKPPLIQIGSHQVRCHLASDKD